MLIRVLLLVVGTFGLLDTLLVSFVSSLNLGVLLPGLLGLPLLLLGLFLPSLSGFFASSAGNICKLVFIGGYCLLFALFTGTWILLDTAAARTAPAGADAVIVLGAGLRGERPTLVLQRRMDTAIAYLAENPDAVAVLSGGKGEGEHISEAEAMARYFAQQGVPESRYIREDASTNTRENFLYSNKIICGRFGQGASIAFVTTDFHVYRAERVAKRQGIEAYGIAAPDVWYLSLNNHLRECMAIWAYAFTGVI